MKYLVVLCDGMADKPVDSLNGKTPMEVADKPIMDMLSEKSLVGTVLNVPPSMVPESDTANLAVLSYDPLIYSKGRSPLEAASMGILLKDNETAFRCNLVTLSEEQDKYEDRIMLDHSSSEISSEDAAVLISAVEEAFGNEFRKFYPGISYRECMVWADAPEKVEFSRPHDILERNIAPYLPKGEDGEAFTDLMRRSYDLLENHPLNAQRRAKGLNPANSIWFWSPGKRASLPSFKDKWGLDATVISAVDLIKGIAKCADIESVDVDGATGTVHTNYSGKAQAAIDAFERGKNFVYIHVEAPDECGHCGEVENKILSIEKIDSLILAPLLDYLKVCGDDFKIMVLPDHPTPLCERTHSSDPVPFLIYSSKEECTGTTPFTEETASKMPTYVPKGQNLLRLMIDSLPTETAKPETAKPETETEAIEETQTAPKKFVPLSHKIFEWVELFAYSLVFVIILMTFVARHSPVIGSSMYPTLEQNDVLIISDIAYKPEIGDIVIIQTPKNDLREPLVKRVIATGGQTIKINFKTWEVWVDGNLIDQSYLGNTEGSMYFYNLPIESGGTWEDVVPKGFVFIMGDNRNDSKDSRLIGFVDERYIIGNVKFRMLPFSKFGSVD